jgi:hypothetical protein
MDSKVYVVGDPTTKAVVVQSKNKPDYGYVRVVQSRSMVGADGFYRKIEVPALIHGFTSDLIHEGYYAGQELPGRVVIKEALTPFNVTEPNRDLKIAGTSEVTCTVNGQAIYRKTIYTEVASVEEVLIAHDNIDEIRAANKRMSSNRSIKPEEDFDLK